MFGFSKKTSLKEIITKKVLRQNDISFILLDERWNNLFRTREKPNEICELESEIRELLKYQSRIIEESKELSKIKKYSMSRILGLTTKVFDEKDETAKIDMKKCEEEIRRVNERLDQIEKEIEDIPLKIQDANLNLLEATINTVYFDIREEKVKLDNIDKVIQETEKKLELYYKEKETLSKTGQEIYAYFHDLLGSEIIEILDKEFFKNKK